MAVHYKTYKGLIENLPFNGIFVFGSNTQGIHGAGAARIAYTKYGAIYGEAYGLQGQSYAIVTKDLNCRVQPSVSKESIKIQISKLYALAETMPTTDFYITHNNLGPNLNHYTHEEMAEMYGDHKHIPSNIIFEESFLPIVLKYYK